jgi:isopenicillin N synthase-like dioxygenase
LPAHEKQILDIKNSEFMQGYFAYGADKSDGVNDDIKEGFDLALDLPMSDPFVQVRLPFYGPNTWPASLPKFKPVLNAYYDHMINLGVTLLGAFSIGLGVDKNFFAERFKKPIAQIRLLRYPPPIFRDQTRVGAGEHTDFGWITMIMQDRTGGLEVKNVDGEWIAVPYIADSFVVNVGDLMQRWTNDEYLATMHRVTNRTDRARYSIAFFMDPDYYVNVECLPTCTSSSKPARYAPIVVCDYMDRRFMETTTFRENALAS